jgi:GST-like protein
MAWLMFQMANLGPVCGQAHHFRASAPEKVPYAIRRFTDEAARLYGVMDRRLGEAAYLGGDDYSIADMACWPWIVPHERHGQRIEEFPNLKRWYDLMKTRPGVRRGFDVGKDIRQQAMQGMDEQARSILFGQRARR